MTQISLEVTIDQEICMGAAYCLRSAESVFTTDASGVVALVDHDEEETSATVPVDLEQRVRAAAATCPSGAITVREVIA